MLPIAEGEWKAGGLTLHNLWFQLQASIHSMELIAALVQDISARQVDNKLNIMQLIAALVQDISARQVDNN
jgi:hypothetical protein